MDQEFGSYFKQNNVRIYIQKKKNDPLQKSKSLQKFPIKSIGSSHRLQLNQYTPYKERESE